MCCLCPYLAKKKLFLGEASLCLTERKKERGSILLSSSLSILFSFNPLKRSAICFDIERKDLGKITTKQKYLKFKISFDICYMINMKKMRIAI